jgi:hypothetical protein
MFTVEHTECKVRGKVRKVIEKTDRKRTGEFGAKLLE